MAYNGTWNIVMKTPMGDREAVLTLAEEGGALTGTMSADGNTMDIADGKVEDGRASWKADITSPMPLTLEFDVAEDGADLDGTVKLGMFGSAGVSGTPA